MGTLPWLDGTLDMQLTQTHDVYAWHKGTLPYAREWNSHGPMPWLNAVNQWLDGKLRQQARLVVHGVDKAIVSLD